MGLELIHSKEIDEPCPPGIVLAEARATFRLMDKALQELSGDVDTTSVVSYELLITHYRVAQRVIADLQSNG